MAASFICNASRSPVQGENKTRDKDVSLSSTGDEAIPRTPSLQLGMDATVGAAAGCPGCMGLHTWVF